MSARDRVIGAADSLNNAARMLPVEGSPRESVKTALRKLDEAESQLRDAIDSYVTAASRKAAR